MWTRDQLLAAIDQHKANGSKPAEIAQDLGVTRQALVQWLSGETNPSGQTLRIAERLWGNRID